MSFETVSAPLAVARALCQPKDMKDVHYERGWPCNACMKAGEVAVDALTAAGYIGAPKDAVEEKQ